jgi:hypothetical protein
MACWVKAETLRPGESREPAGSRRIAACLYRLYFDKFIAPLGGKVIEMTKQQAIHEICSISYGTLATLTGKKTYDELDQVTEQLIDKINIADVSGAERWQDVWDLIARYPGRKGD